MDQKKVLPVKTFGPTEGYVQSVMLVLCSAAYIGPTGAGPLRTATSKIIRTVSNTQRTTQCRVYCSLVVRFIQLVRLELCSD